MDRIYFSHSLPALQLPTSPAAVESSSAALDRTVVYSGSPELVIYFDNDSSNLRAQDIERLQSFVLSFSAELYPLFLITGHTDSNHTDQYNHYLSERRALSTRSEMLKMGVPSEKTALRGLGESQPIASNENATGRQTNRRVTVSVLNPNMKSTEESQTK